ncbi:putative tRNA cytidine 32 guanosine 34 2'-O methyltransferase [Taenia crassiceps]|uniref:Putative tRNA (cytidine(32)/guanosine(34)-2'-O)-methyltransferase n=1 Tax=Taenia crassiceps TaxID=6207 RepID=A0ABR4QCX5_9CEST
MGKSSRDKRDIFYRLAKEEGWRARSAYKLLQLDDEFNILAHDYSGNPLTRVVDLCAAPGSWSQVLSKKLWEPRSEVDRQEVKIVAVDLQAMAPIPGVTQLQGDITSRETADRVIKQFKGKKAQLVVCDGAPDVTGLHELDEYVQSHLVLAALTICARILENGGTFVAKVFRGREAGLLGAQLRCLFAGEVVFAKPSSSRNSSLESFVVCRTFRGDEVLPPSLTSITMSDHESSDNSVDSLMAWLSGLDQLTPEQRVILPFVACGDLSGYDADSCYELGDDYTPLGPIQPPLSAAYLGVCRKTRTATAGNVKQEDDKFDQILSQQMEETRLN